MMNTRTRRTATALALAGAVMVTGAGCAKRNIDPAATGSARVEGTGGEHALQKFCDGPTLIYWTPGYSGEEDEYEAFIYESPACTDDGDPATIPAGVVGAGPQQPRDAGVQDDDE